MTLQQLATALGIPLHRGDDETRVSTVASIASAESGSLVFSTDDSTTAAALASPASAAIIPSLSSGIAGDGMPVLLSSHPRLHFARAAHLLHQLAATAGVHPTAVIDASASIHPTVSIGAFVVIGSGSVVGEQTVVGAGTVLGDSVIVGAGCHLFPKVVIYSGTALGDRVVVHAGAVLGADGFGYVRDAATGRYTQFPQQGRLILEDDVEVGANTTIDRGALEETRIGQGTKIDNLVHLGHNVIVGKNTVIAAQTGVSGSTTIGDDVMLGGQAGLGDHAHIGDGVILGGQGGVLPGKKLLGPGVVFWGTPAKPVKSFLRELATLSRLTRSRQGPGKE